MGARDAAGRPRRGGAWSSSADRCRAPRGALARRADRERARGATPRRRRATARARPASRPLPRDDRRGDAGVAHDRGAHAAGDAAEHGHDAAMRGDLLQRPGSRRGGCTSHRSCARRPPSAWTSEGTCGGSSDGSGASSSSATRPRRGRSRSRATQDFGGRTAYGLGRVRVSAEDRRCLTRPRVCSGSRAGPPLRRRRARSVAPRG